MKKMKPLDITVATLAALSCLLMVAEIPVWSLFIGWAWYYTLGGELHVFKKATPPMIMGSFWAVVFFFFIDFMPASFPSLLNIMILVFLTVVGVMMSLHIPMFSAALPAFNSYSCIFIGYAAKSYLSVEGMPPLLNAWIWITGANFIGLLFGWFSLKVEKKLTEKFPRW